MRFSLLPLLSLLLITLVSLSGCGKEESLPVAPTPTYVDVSPSEALVLINETPDLYIIDVSDQYPSGHIPNAINYGLESGLFAAVIPFLSLDRTYLVYAHDDATSTSAAQMLIDAGFLSVYRLDGSFGAWVAAGLPVNRPSG